MHGNAFYEKSTQIQYGSKVQLVRSFGCTFLRAHNKHFVALAANIKL